MNIKLIIQLKILVSNLYQDVVGFEILVTNQSMECLYSKYMKNNNN